MITLFAPNGPKVLGPGASLSARSDLLPLDNPPYNWTFTFTGPDLTFNFSHHKVTQFTTDTANVLLLWNDETIPSQILADIHAKLNDNVKINVQVQNQAGETIDQMVEETWQWDPTAWLHLNTRLWTNNLVSRIGSGGGDDKLDQILAAVIRTWQIA